MVKMMIDIKSMTPLDKARYDYYVHMAQISDNEVEVETYLEQIKMFEKRYPVTKDLSIYFIPEGV